MLCGQTSWKKQHYFVTFVQPSTCKLSCHTIVVMYYYISSPLKMNDLKQNEEKVVQEKVDQLQSLVGKAQAMKQKIQVFNLIITCL